MKFKGYALIKLEDENTELSLHDTMQDAIDAAKKVRRNIHELGGEEGDFQMEMKEIQDCLENEGVWYEDNGCGRTFLVMEVCKD